jgi:predicted unusual protein kinase regulating ubiquinone biosynthesis (AarF/ABC1/UbiB family)
VGTPSALTHTHTHTLTRGMSPFRPDVLPPAAVYELQKLCDAVPPFPTGEAIATIEKELGIAHVAQVFAGLDQDTAPIASASLGQATLLSVPPSP